MVKRGGMLEKLILFVFLIFSIIFLSGFASAACQAMAPSIDINPADIERQDLAYTFSIDITNNDLGCPAKDFTLQVKYCNSIPNTNPKGSSETCVFTGSQQTYQVTALNAGEKRTLSGVFFMNTGDAPTLQVVRFFSIIRAYPTTNPTQGVNETAIIYWQVGFSGGIRNPTITSPAGKSGTGTQTFSYTITQNTPGDDASIGYLLTALCPTSPTPWTCTFGVTGGSEIWLTLGQTRTFTLSVTPPAGTNPDTYPIFFQVHGDQFSGDYQYVWQLSPITTYTYTGGTPPSETNCIDSIDNDGDGYIDYADLNDCIPSSCSGVITGRISGSGDGAAWTPDDLTPNIAKCCSSTNCLDIAPGSNACVSSGTTRTIDGYSFVCSASVWCKNGGIGGIGYHNDGDGNCVGGDIAQNAFTGLDACLAPSIAFYQGFDDKKISLWNLTNVLYESNNGIDFNPILRSSLVAEGIPLNYQPILGVYYNISGSDGEILLFDADGVAYIYKLPFEYANPWISYNKASNGLPATFAPISARYTMQPPGLNNKGVVELDNISNGEYRIGGLSATSWNDATSLYGYPQYSNYPMGNPLLVTYYYNISGNEHMAYWLNVSGTLKVYQYNGAGYDSFQEITPMLTGLPSLDQMPTEGYFDPIRKKIVIWYGNEVYESENNIYFKKVNVPECNLCGNEALDSGEQCDDGNTINEDECTNLCLNAVCGDGYLNQADEQCDLGPDNGQGLGCKSNCKFEQEELCSSFEIMEDCNNPLKWNDQILRKVEEHNQILAETNEWPYDFCTTGKVSGVSCGCSWNLNLEQCVESVGFNSGQCFITNVITGTCSAGNTATELWTAVWNNTETESPENGCVSGSKLYNCQLIAKVPFFNLTNLLISIFLIGILYLIINIKKIK